MATKKPGTEIVDHNAILAGIAAKQAKAAASLASGSAFASFKNGALVINGAAQPNGKANIVVLAMMRERAYYGDEYNADQIVPPDCFAFGEVNGGETFAPHPEAQNPQAETCAECPRSKYGSAARGRGQACRDIQRIAFIPSDNKTEADSSIVQAKIPPTSLKNVKAYLDELGASGMATVQAVTELTVRPDPKTQITVTMRPVGAVKPGVIGSVVKRLAAAEKALQEPYRYEEEKPKAAKKTAKRKF
jgi:hypothetical protein